MAEETRNLSDVVARAAAHGPERPALISADGTLNWGEVDAAVSAVAAGLTGLDLPRQDAAPARVAIALPNVAEFAVTFFGALRAGLTAVPVNPGYTPRELRHQLTDAGAAVLVATREVAEAVAGIDTPALRRTYVVGNATGVRNATPFGELTSAAPARAAVPATGGDDLAALLYTSGVAGAPKGAMLSHRALIANHRQVDQISPQIVGPDDVLLLVLPLFHAFGLNTGLGAVAWHGACGVLLDRFDPVETLAAIRRHGVTVITAVPPMFAAWAALPDVAEAMASVRVLISGAAPLAPAIARRFAEASGREITQGYGLTETAPVLTTALASPVAKAGSVGRPIPEVEIRLVAGDGGELARVTSAGLLDVDADDLDDDAGTDPGEVVARGPNLFDGYWPDGAGGPDADGWWATGDVAYADEDGDLFLVDRLGELIIVSGFNVYPHEVELVLAAHPGVAEAAVVAMDSEATGQAVRAYVVAAPGTNASVAELAEHCERNLARFKCPSVIEFVDELPHSATGKVRKRDIEERA